MYEEDRLGGGSLEKMGMLTMLGDMADVKDWALSVGRK